MKILIVATNWVGDAVMSIPALQVVRRRWPTAEVVVLARPLVADLYRGQEYVDRVILQENSGRHRGIQGREGLARELRAEKFDTALLLPNSFASAWVAWRAGIPERIGYARDGRSLLLSRAIRVPRRNLIFRDEVPARETYYYLELLRRAGWLDRLPQIERIELHVPAEARQAAEQRLIAAGTRRGATWVAFAPGANYGAAKCWPPERYAALADQLIGAHDADVIFFGTPQESEMVSRIERAMRRRAVNLAGVTQIGELPALLAACRLFVGNDSGAMHVAAAVGVPVVGIFGSSDPRGTSPVTPNFALVRQQVSCSPCFLRRCPIDHRCMTRISVAEVFAAAERLSGPGAKAPLPVFPASRSAASLD